jgi:ABC-type nitrate/sulfonate/bicarbonate transport system permease component
MKIKQERLLTYLASLALTFTAWHLLSTFVFNPKLVPGPFSVAVSAWDMLTSLELFEHIGISLQRILIGFVLGTVVGILGGTAMGRSRVVDGMVDPPITLLRQIPAVAIIPLAIVWFGIGENSRYFVIFYGVMIIVLISTAAGVRSTPEIRIQAARCLGAGKFRIFWTIVLPSAVPNIVTAMRLGLGLAFASVVAAEIIASNAGIGYLIMQSRNVLQIDRMFVGLLTLGVLGATADQVFKFVVARTLSRFQIGLGR